MIPPGMLEPELSNAYYYAALYWRHKVRVTTEREATEIGLTVSELRASRRQLSEYYSREFKKRKLSYV